MSRAWFFDELSGSPRESQKEGQEDKGMVKELEGALPLAVRRKPLHLF